ncbi:unnamed protein product [Soboliphyme baturini]|uniref:Bestrophin homolog n=1 Tax=Soboliphyme baturini TaxID=241478 RepID=A0A183IXS9_9BILA|nr:unnamed protein product [Soboliphyme baturini]
MTISYSRDVASIRLSKFVRLLFKWKGSIYRLLYKELIVFLALYLFLSVLYRFCLNEEGSR